MWIVPVVRYQGVFLAGATPHVSISNSTDSSLYIYVDDRTFNSEV